VKVAVTVAVLPSSMASPTADTLGSTFSTVTVVVSLADSPPGSVTVRVRSSTVSSTPEYTGVGDVASSRLAVGVQE